MPPRRLLVHLKADDQPATVRCHFADGSWADVVALGAGRGAFLEQLRKV